MTNDPRKLQFSLRKLFRNFDELTLISCVIGRRRFEPNTFFFFCLGLERVPLKRSFVEGFARVHKLAKLVTRHLPSVFRSKESRETSFSSGALLPGIVLRG